MAELVAGSNVSEDGSNVSEDVSSESTDGDADAAEGDAGGHHGAQDVVIWRLRLLDCKAWRCGPLSGVLDCAGVQDCFRLCCPACRVEMLHCSAGGLGLLAQLASS